MFELTNKELMPIRCPYCYSDELTIITLIPEFKCPNCEHQFIQNRKEIANKLIGEPQKSKKKERIWHICSANPTTDFQEGDVLLYPNCFTIIDKVEKRGKEAIMLTLDIQGTEHYATWDDKWKQWCVIR